MIAERNFGGDRPVTWVGSFPVYVSTLLAAAHAVTMVLTGLAMGAGAEGAIQMFVFSSDAVLRSGAIWQTVTYAFVHQPPYLLFLLELYLLVMFGREIERFLGRAAFIQLYTVLLLLPPVALCAAGLLGFPSIYADSGALHFGVFAAFAALYPRAEIFFSIQARWIVLAFFVVNAVQCIALNDFVALGVLALDSAAGVLLVLQMKGGGISFPRIGRRPTLRVVKPEPPAAPAARPPVRTPASAGIDTILDKISKTGMASLTADERNALEAARAELLQKEKGR